MNVRFTSFAAGVAVGVALAVSVGSVAQGRKIPEETMQQLRRFTEVFGAVKTNFAGSFDEAKAFDGCIMGLLRHVDPQSAYYDKQEFEQMKPSPRNPRGGVGIEITPVSGRAAVVSAIEGGPADRAGILSGDLIVKINQVDTTAMSLDEVAKLLSGAPGSPIRLTLARTGLAGAIDLDLTREVIRVTSVRSRLLAQGIGYVRIAQFREETPELLVRAMEQLKSANGGPLKGLLLDLRNNPGGLLQSGVAVAAAFLAEGLPIVSLEGPTQESRRKYAANPLDYRGLPKDFRARVPESASVPLVVLVNSGSAASSEIVAASLQDHKRATIVGEKTFGRGSVQTIFPFFDNTAVKITSAYSYAPSGRAIHGGVTPDVWTNTASKSPMISYGEPSDEPLKRAVEVLRNL